MTDLLAYALNKAFSESFLAAQTVEGVRRNIKRANFKHVIELMKDVRAIRAGYARTYRGNLRAKRTAADVRACEACGRPLTGKRQGAKTCSTRCRVAVSRKRQLEASGS